MPRHPIDLIGFDADDTLWQNEAYFRLSQARFSDLLKDHAETDDLAARLLQVEKRNLGRYGFGVKGFVLSMIETAIEVTQGRVPAPVIAELLAAGREMLEQPIELLPHVQSTVETLAADHPLVLITKGDLLDQERKLAQSGLGGLFAGVEILSDKTPQTYSQVFDRHGTPPDRAMMVGNSLKSDILPVLSLGGTGVHVPHGLSWALDLADPPEGHPRFHQLDSMAGLADLVKTVADT
jgi:putative hydrolase of the HAD superfamily